MDSATNTGPTATERQHQQHADDADRDGKSTAATMHDETEHRAFSAQMPALFQLPTAAIQPG